MDYLISSSQEDYEEDIVIVLILQLEKERNLPRVTQLMSGRAGISTQAV